MGKARTQHIEAVVLERTKLGESDLILRLLQSDGSLAQAVAKGARKPSGKLASKSEYFSQVDFLLAKGKSLDIVSEAQLIDAHLNLRGKPEATNAAFAICEIARLTSFEDAEDPFLYQICLRALKACEQAEKQEQLDIVVSAYAFKVLAHQGWYPVLDECVSCSDQNPTRFSAQAGGVLCESCSKDIEGAEPISQNIIDWIKYLLNATFDDILTIEIDAQSSLELLSLSHRWAATHLDARLRAFEFLMGVFY